MLKCYFHTCLSIEQKKLGGVGAIMKFLDVCFPSSDCSFCEIFHSLGQIFFALFVSFEIGHSYNTPARPLVTKCDWPG